MIKQHKNSCKTISTALAITIAALSTSTALFSVSAENQYGKIYCIDAQKFDPQVMEALARGIDNYQTSINIYEYNVSKDELGGIVNAMKNCYPELFFFSGINYNYIGNTVYSIKPKYDDTTDNIIARRQLFNAAADSLLAKVDSSMSDFEKALLLHDELAVHGNYAYRTCADDYLIDGLGQCSAYAAAYSYLLSRVGIDSEIVESDEINHAWNKVCIDGTYYNVDVTWDDPTTGFRQEDGDYYFWDNPGHAYHNYFLRSDYSFQNDSSLSLHTGYESLFESPGTYDNYAYINSTSKFCYENGELYYVDNTDSRNAHLRKYNYQTNSCENLKDFSVYWSAGSGRYYSKSYMTLGSENGILYYNGPSAVYAYDISSGEETVFSNNAALQDKCYGVVVKNGGVYAALKDAPGNEASMLYLGETIKPEPTTAEPTTEEPTTAEPTTVEPTTIEPTTIESTTIEPTTIQPTTIQPTTIEPTTIEPTTIQPTTVEPTTAEPTTEPKQILYGDVDMDGYISILDATMIQKYLVGFVQLSDDALAAADTNHDGQIDIADATNLQRFLAFLIDEL